MSKASKSFKKIWIDRLRKDPELVVEYLKAEIEENSDMPEALLSALRVVAEATGYEALAKKAHLSQKSLYKILSENRDTHPRFETVYRLLDAVGLKLTVEPKMLKKMAI